MRITSAIVVMIALVAAVSIAYVEACDTCADCNATASATACAGSTACAGESSCDGDCDTCTCKKAKSCDGDCATCDCPKGKTKCAKAKGSAKANAKCADACANVEGTVRYVRSTKKAVKVMNGDKGYLLRVGGDCGGCQKSMISTITNLEKGDAVVASFQTCATSGRYYLCTLKTAGADAAESTAPEPAAESTTEGTSS